MRGGSDIEAGFIHVIEYSLKYLKRDVPLVPCEINQVYSRSIYLYLTSANSRPPLWIALAALVGKLLHLGPIQLERVSYNVRYLRC